MSLLHHAIHMLQVDILISNGYSTSTYTTTQEKPNKVTSYLYSIWLSIDSVDKYSFSCAKFQLPGAVCNDRGHKFKDKLTYSYYGCYSYMLHF